MERYWGWDRDSVCLGSWSFEEALGRVRVFDFRVGVLRHRRRGLDWNVCYGASDGFDGDGVCRFGDVVVRVSVVLPFVEGCFDAALVRACHEFEQVLDAQS